MPEIQLPSNFIKHTTTNPLQKILIKNFYRSLLSLVKDVHPKSVLDAGCGEGFTLEQVNNKKKGTLLEGIDSSSEAIRIGIKMHPSFKLIVGDIYDLPYKNNSFDLVLCTEVLEHLAYPKKAFKEIHRVSKKYIVISVPNEPFFLLSNLLRGKYLSRLGNHPEHINHWTILSLKRFIHVNNGKIVRTKYPFPWILVLIEK